MDVLAGADALVIVTEWSLFRSPDFDAIRQQLKQALIFDGRKLRSGLSARTGFRLLRHRSR